jgi:hypothetical protein
MTISNTLLCISAGFGAFFSGKLANSFGRRSAIMKINYLFYVAIGIVRPK